VPDGASLDGEGNVYVGGVRTGKVPPCQYVRPLDAEALEDGNLDPPAAISHAWVEWGSQTTTPWFNEIGSTWVVPNSPLTPWSNQIIYMFNDVQSVTWIGGILQPVLAWGWGGLHSWVMMDAYAWNTCSSPARCDTWTHTTPINVSVGDTIDGLVMVNPIGCSDGGTNTSWKVDYRVNGGIWHEYAVQTSYTMTRADNGVLEVYYLDSCYGLPFSAAPTPGSVTFTNWALARAYTHCYTFNSVTPNFVGQVASGLGLSCGWDTSSSTSSTTVLEWEYWR